MLENFYFIAKVKQEYNEQIKATNKEPDFKVINLYMNSSLPPKIFQIRSKSKVKSYTE